MADTFSNDLRLRLQESGSNAGTWGDLLNGTITNIASGFGQGSEVIPNASTHTITLADGTADEARSLYLKCTGGGQACTVTLGPNTISKVWIIDNATSYTLTFSQGSGANVAIAAGAVKVIATDGAGSGAAVVDTLDGLEGSLSSLAVSGAVTANGGIALPDDGVLSLGTSDELTLKHHNSGYSHLINTTGTLYVDSDSVTFRDDDGSPSNMVISQTGIDVTGNVTANPSGGVITLGASGQITSKQSLDVATAGGRFIGSSNRGILGQIRIEQTANSTDGGYIAFDTSPSGSTSPAERMKIDGATGNLLVGRSSDSGLGKLQVYGGADIAGGNVYLARDTGNVLVGSTTSTGSRLSVIDTATASKQIVFSNNTTYYGSVGHDAGTGYNEYRTESGGSHGFYKGTSATPDLMIDTAGNFIVGGTQSNPTGANVAGASIDASGEGNFSVDGAEALRVNRLTSDGAIVQFMKAGQFVGSIGAAGGDLYIGTGAISWKFFDAGGAILPADANGGAKDNAVNLGSASARMEILFAGTGTINTSDRNEKQDIETLSDAEQRVAVACKGLLRKFRWIDSVETKGDDARIHFGIIAQDLQAAFTAEGLDAARYAMFCSDTWTDEETGEERTRLGVRYSELLAFIIAAI